MKETETFIPFHRSFKALVGTKGASLIGLGIFFSMALAAVEYVIAITMTFVFFSLHLLDATAVPPWLRFLSDMVTPATAWGALMVAGIVRALCQLTSQQSGLALLEYVRSRLYRIHGYQLLFSDKSSMPSQSTINFRINELFPKTSDYIYNLTAFLSSAMLSVTICTGMVLIAWKQTLLGVLCLITMGMIIARLGMYLKSVAPRIPDQRRKTERSLIRIYRNWLPIRIMQIQKKEYETYIDSVTNYERYSRKAFYYQNLSSVIPPILGLFAVLVIIYTSVRYFGTPSTSLMGFIYLFFRFTQSIVALTDRWNTMQRFETQVRASFDLIQSLPPEDLQAALHPDTVTEEKDRLNGPAGHPANHRSGRPDDAPAIDVTNVTYSWPRSGRAVFENFSLHIPAGSIFGIIGPNGSGKSTLLGVILGVLQPTSGTVAIGGQPAASYFQNGSVIGYVSDDPCLIFGTVRENLLYGLKETASDAEITETLGLVGLHEAIMLKKGGLDYIIQESGEGLSSGQKQRLALARAFLRKPSLLILDEASANLDKSAENDIASILNNLKKRCTMIIVSHKMGILKEADHILDLGEHP